MNATRMRRNICVLGQSRGTRHPGVFARSTVACSRAMLCRSKPPSIVCMADHRRMIIKRRSAPPAQRNKRRYRDEPRGLELDPTSPRFSGRLTTEINSANGPLQLARLIQDHGLAFSGTQVTMALGRLAAFATFQQLTDDQLAAQARATRRCVLLLRQKVPDCDLLSHARGAYALGRLGVYDPGLMSDVVEDVYDKLNLFGPDGLSALMAGLAALGHRPPDGWLDRFALEVYTRFGRFNGQELANVMYGMARLQYTPSGAWVERCLECFRATMAMPAAPPMSPAMVKFAFALASLQIRPSFNWTTAFIARARPHLDSLSARELAVLLWALSRMLPTAQPQPLAAAMGRPARSDGGAASGTLAGDARRGASPGSTPAAAGAAAGVGAPVAAMAVGLDRTFLDAWYRCAARRMASANAPSLVLALQALAVLQVHQPPPKYVNVLLAQLRAALPDDGAYPGGAGGGPLLQQPGQAEAAVGLLGGAEAVSVLLSLVALRIRPGPEWMESCLAALEPSLPDLAAPVLCDLAWALARFQYQPSPEWVRLFNARCAALQTEFTPQELSLLSWAFQQLRVTLPPFVRNLVDTAAAAVTQGEQFTTSEKGGGMHARTNAEDLQSKVAKLMLESP